MHHINFTGKNNWNLGTLTSKLEFFAVLKQINAPPQLERLGHHMDVCELDAIHLVNYAFAEAKSESGSIKRNSALNQGSAMKEERKTLIIYGMPGEFAALAQRA